MIDCSRLAIENPKLRFVYLSIRTETHKVGQTKVGGTLHLGSMEQAQGPALGEKKPD